MKKEKWEIFWGEYRNSKAYGINDLFNQVGKTINGIPISKSIFENMIIDIQDKLDLSIQDNLVELCCGNGIITYPLSNVCKNIYAFDFTSHLIENAKKFSSNKNITYKVGDAKKDFLILFNLLEKPNKYLMNDSLGYFSFIELTKIIRYVMSEDTMLFYITGIPLDELKWNFYNTPERKEHFLKLEKGGSGFYDGIGKWWKENEFKKIAKLLNLKVTLKNQPKEISNFRANVLFEK